LNPFSPKTKHYFVVFETNRHTFMLMLPANQSPRIHLQHMAEVAHKITYRSSAEAITFGVRMFQPIKLPAFQV
jgi:hypothetical protein